MARSAQRTRRPRARQWILVGVLGLAVFGCGSRGDPNKSKLTGTVSFDGKALSVGTINFASDSNVTAMSAIDPQGQYAVELPPGDYKVAIRSEEPATMGPQGQPVPAKSHIPEKYSSIATSGLTAKVEKGAVRKDFDLKP